MRFTFLIRAIDFIVVIKTNQVKILLKCSSLSSGLIRKFGHLKFNVLPLNPLRVFLLLLGSKFEYHMLSNQEM